MVSTATQVYLIIGGLIALGCPIALLIYFNRKEKLSWAAIGIGALVWVVFSQVLEKAMHLFMLTTPTTADFLKAPFWFALYGGLAAGLFEETGRYVAFRFWLKRRRAWKDGLAYGIGHGGIEAIFIGVFTSINYLVYAMLINTGQFDKLMQSLNTAAKGNALVSTQTATLLAAKASLLHATPALQLVGGLERVPSVLLHIGLSILVLYAVKQGRKSLFGLAILIHAFVDFVAAYLSSMHVSLLVTESFIWIVGLLSLVWVVKSKRRMEEHVSGDSIAFREHTDTKNA